MNPSDLLHIVDDALVLLAAVASAYAAWHAKKAHESVNGGGNSLAKNIDALETTVHAAIDAMPAETPPKP